MCDKDNVSIYFSPKNTKLKFYNNRFLLLKEGKQFPALKNDLIIRAAKGEDVYRVPVWIMRQAGRYLKEFRDMRVEQTFFDLCQNPKLACEVTLMVLFLNFECLNRSKCIS